MSSGFLQLDWANVKSAIVYGILTALLSMALYAVSVGDVFALNSHALTNAGVFGGLSVLISLFKNLLTDNGGNFLGAVKVIPPTN